jgi:adenine-specific DNA-methyltransferase
MGRAGVKADRLAEYDSDYGSFKPVQNQRINKTPEEKYSQDVPIGRRRKFGQFFTPESVAGLMADWILEKNPMSVIDPAVGCGVFPRTIGRVYNKNPEFDCYDVDEMILSYIEDRYNIVSEINVCDFLQANIEKKYDAAIMNPPYLRHHDMIYSGNIHEKISALECHHISKTANAYVLFVMKACHLLKQGGRGAFIIPTEWSNANFGESFKDYLINKAGLKGIVYFSNCSDIFEDALTTACILLVEKDGKSQDRIPVTYVEGATQSSVFPSLSKMRSLYKTNNIDSNILSSSSKWDYLIKNGEQKEVSGFIRLGDIADSKRGIATGANDFFHVNSIEAKRIGISPRNIISCIGKASDVKGILFSSDDLSRLVKEGKKTSLISIRNQLNESEKIYVSHGEALGLHERYLLSKRRPWYSMEERPPAPIWGAVFGREELRFIHNEAGASNLTTFHGIYPKRQDDTFIRALTVALNSRIVQARARAHIRVYGGGLLKFEPKDLLEIQIPNLDAVSQETLASLSKCLPTSSKGEIDHARVDFLICQAAEEASNKAA